MRMWCDWKRATERALFIPRLSSWRLLQQWPQLQSHVFHTASSQSWLNSRAKWSLLWFCDDDDRDGDSRLPLLTDVATTLLWLETGVFIIQKSCLKEWNGMGCFLWYQLQLSKKFRKYCNIGWDGKVIMRFIFVRYGYESCSFCYVSTRQQRQFANQLSST